MCIKYNCTNKFDQFDFKDLKRAECSFEFKNSVMSYGCML